MNDRSTTTQENLPLGALTGVLVGTALTAAWLGVTVWAFFEMRFLALPIGVGVGLAMRHWGRGTSQAACWWALGLAVTLTVLGNYLALVALLSLDQSIPLLEFVAREGLNPLIANANLGDFMIVSVNALTSYQLAVRPTPAPRPETDTPR